MKAYQILGPYKERIGHFIFSDKKWTGIRVQKRRNGEITHAELSRWSGTVADLTISTVTVTADTEIQIEETLK